jgi:hypothetical protein
LVGYPDCKFQKKLLSNVSNEKTEDQELDEDKKPIVFGKYSSATEKTKSFVTVDRGHRYSLIVDSSCTDHMVSSNAGMHNLCSDHHVIQIKDGKCISSVQIWSLNGVNPTCSTKLIVGGVLVVPKLDSSLLSISSLNRANITTTFKNSEVEFRYQNKVVAKGYLKNKLYFLDLIVSGPPSILNVSFECGTTV